MRDESDEQVRLVLVPKSRNVDPELLKESLYKLTDLETRFGLNLNVLDATRTPMVMGLHELLLELGRAPDRHPPAPQPPPAARRSPTGSSWSKATSSPSSTSTG